MSAVRIAALTVSALVACSGSGGAADPLEELRRDILDLNGHVIVMKTTGRFAEYRDVIATAAREPGVVSGLPFVFVELKATLRGRTEVASLKGVALDRTPVGEHLTPRNALDGHRPPPPADAATVDPGAPDHAPDDLADPPAPPTDFTATAKVALPPAPEIHVAIGEGLARKLDARIGDVLELELVPLLDHTAWDQPPPPPRRARIVGTFPLRHYDQELLLTTFEAAQELVGLGDVVLGIELRLTRAADAVAFARTLAAKLGSGYDVVDWCELNRAVFRC